MMKHQIPGGTTQGFGTSSFCGLHWERHDLDKAKQFIDSPAQQIYLVYVQLNESMITEKYTLELAGFQISVIEHRVPDCIRKQSTRPLFWLRGLPSLLLTQSLQPCRCLSSRQLFTEMIGCIGKWLNLVESYWTLQIPHPMDAGCDHFGWMNVWLRRYSPSKCVVSIPSPTSITTSFRQGTVETWFWKVSWQRRIRGGAKCCGYHGKSSSQVDTNKNWIKMFNSLLCSIQQRVPMLEVLECSASFDEEKEHLGHFSCWPLSLVHLWQFPSCCQGVQTCRWGASPPNVGCSPSIRRSTSPRAMKHCGRGETVMIWIFHAWACWIMSA